MVTRADIRGCQRQRTRTTGLTSHPAAIQLGDCRQNHTYILWITLTQSLDIQRPLLFVVYQIGDIETRRIPGAGGARGIIFRADDEDVGHGNTDTRGKEEACFLAPYAAQTRALLYPRPAAFGPKGLVPGITRLDDASPAPAGRQTRDARYSLRILGVIDHN